MLETILAVIILILSVIGFVELMRIITINIISDKEDYGFIVIPMKGHCEDAERKLRSAACSINWLDGCQPQEIICLDCGTDEDTEKICKIVCQDYSFMKFKKFDEFKKDICSEK